MPTDYLQADKKNVWDSISKQPQLIMSVLLLFQLRQSVAENAKLLHNAKVS